MKAAISHDILLGVPLPRQTVEPAWEERNLIKVRYFDWNAPEERIGRAKKI